MNHREQILLVLIVVALNGCLFTSASIKDPSTYTPVSLVKADVMPSENDLNNKKSRVVIFGIDDDGVALANQSDVGVTITAALEQHISKSNADVVNSAGLLALKSSVEKGEALSGLPPADYVITGTVGAANFSKTFSEATSITDKKGKVTNYPAQCNYNAQVTSNIRIYNLTSGKPQLTDTLDIANSAATSSDSAGTSLAACPDYSPEALTSLVRTAGAGAVNSSSTKLMNLFAPKGYVLEKRTDGKTSIIKISLGSVNGAQSKQKAIIYTLIESKHPITGNTTLEKQKIVDGLVTDQISARHVWIKVDDEALAEKIRLGDLVEVQYETFWEKVF